MSTNVYTSEGLFDFTSDAAIEALKLMKQIMALANPDILLEGASDGGVNGTPDEVAFAAQRVGYYIKYFNAPLRMAANWDDPKLLHLGPLPKFANGEGSTVFWTTGCALFKYGQNKEKAAEYIKALTYDQQIWKDSIVGTPSGHPGQLPPYKSIYADWDANKPDWMPPFVGLVRGQLDKAKAITNHLFGLQQFVIGKPDLGDLPQGRGGRSEGGHAEGRRRGPGRDEEAASSRCAGEDRGGRSGPRSSARSPMRGALHERSRAACLASMASESMARAHGTDDRIWPRRGWPTSLAAAMALPRRASSAWLFLLPALVFFVGYQVWPIFRVLWISFTDYQFLSNEPAQLGRVRQLHRRRSTTR